MESTLAHLQDVSVRSLVLATLAAAVLWLMGRCSAAARHAIWSIVLAGMLVQFAAAPLLPPIPLRILAETSPRSPAGASSWRGIAFAIYAAVALLLLIR